MICLLSTNPRKYRAIPGGVFLASALFGFAGLTPSVAAQPPAKAPVFSKITPPLMKDVTADWVFENPIFLSDKATVSALISVSGEQAFTGGGRSSEICFTRPVPAKVTTYYRWRLVDGPTWNGLDTTLTYSTSITDSMTTTAALGAKLGASVEASGGVPGFAKVKATLSAEVSASLEVAKSQAQTKTTSVEVKIPGSTYVAVWRLEQIVEIVYDPFTVEGWVGGPIQPQPESYVIPVVINVTDSFTPPQSKPLPK